MESGNRAVGQSGNRDVNYRGIQLLDGLNRDAQRALSRSGIHRFAPGEFLWHAGEHATALHVVLEGEVRVVRSSGGRRRVVHTEGRGGTLGDVAVFAGSVYPATAQAASRVVTLALTPELVFAVIAADPSFALRLLERLAQRVRQVIGRFDQVSALTVQARVARFLLDRHMAANGKPFTLGMTQQQLAEELGTVREVIVRVLRDLRSSGAIEAPTRGRFRVANVETLTAFTRP